MGDVMRTTLERSHANDLLSDDEVRLVTKVPKGAQNGLTKQMKVLDGAGIHYWLGDDKSICTTWHHVHNARPRIAQNDSAVPAFGKTK